VNRPSGSDRLDRATRLQFILCVVNPTSDLTAALRERLAIIGDESSRRDPEQHMMRLRENSERIDNLAAALPRPIDPQLAHFLQRKSYDKALELLEGRAPLRP
jgi:hypothetical protein